MYSYLEKGHAVEEMMDITVGVKKQDGLDEDHSCSEDIPLLGDLPIETSDKDIPGDISMEISNTNVLEKTTIGKESEDNTLTGKMTVTEKTKRKRMKITKRKRGSINSQVNYLL